jgi:serine/threonine protein kinase
MDGHVHLELAETTMADLLVGNYLDLSTRLRLFMQLVKGLEFLHENGIVHNDLKPSNLLIVKNELKIGDFGLSNFHLPLIAPMAGARLCGTPLYTSPDQTTSLKSDIFTLGVVLTEFLVDYGERYDALTTLRTPEFRWEAYETLQPFRQLIQRMLLTDPQSRPTASEVRHVLMDNIKQYGFANTIACGIESGETRWEVEIPKPPTLKEFFEERAKTVSLENQLKVLQRTLIERDTSARATAHRVSELEAELAQVNQLNEMRKENSPKFNVSSDHINLPPKPSESQPQWREEAAQGA